MDLKSEKIDESIINALLQSNDLKEIIKKLVQGEIQNSGNEESAIQKLSEIFSLSSLCESNTQFKPSKHSSIIPVNDLRPDKMHYTEEEASLRCSLASLFRLIDMEGWAKSIYNLITFRLSTIDNNSNNYFINPFGLLYHEITGGSLVKINSNGDIIDSGCTVLGINKKNWAMHECIYNARKDITCMVQLSLPDVVAVSSIKSGLLPVSIEAIKLLDVSPNSLSGGGVKYHEISYDNKNNQFQKLISNLGNSKILFLRNNSLLVCASSIPEVWVLTKTIVTACQAQIRLIQLGGKNLLYSECNFTKSNTLFSDLNLELNNSGYKTDAYLDFELEFEAMMRLLDNAGYRTGHKYSNKRFKPEYIKSISANGDDTLNHVENEENSQSCPSPGDEATTEDLFPDEHRIQICPMPPHENEMHQNFVPNEKTDQMNEVSDNRDDTDSPIINGDDISLREHELVKEICAEIIDNSVKFCQEESSFQNDVNEASG